LNCGGAGNSSTPAIIFASGGVFALFEPRLLTKTFSIVLPVVLGIQPAKESPYAIHKPAGDKQGVDDQNDGFERNVDLPFTIWLSPIASR
jgi:hypothetical protein